MSASSRPSRLLLAALLALAPARLAAQPAAARATSPDTLVPVLLAEEDIVAFVDEPSEHMIRAREAIRAGDRRRAGTELSAAAAFLRVQESRATSAVSKADLAEASRDLDRLAREATSGALKDVDALDDRLRGADRALARHHLERASAAWARGERGAAARELGGAASYTERLAHDARQDADAGTRDAVRGARAVTAKIADGAGWTSDEVGKAFTALGNAIDRLGSRVHGR